MQPCSQPRYGFIERSNPKVAAHFAKATVADNQKRLETPIHKIVEIDGEHYVERPEQATLGYGFRKSRSFKPQMIITTTEMVTTHYARRTMARSELRSADWIDVFRTVDCDVTAISAAITRKASHAVLLPIIELLKEEFPEENLTLIADGLGCKFNLSNSKGRNDLRDSSTIIKLSWPHPHVIAKARVHLGPYLGSEDPASLDHNQMVAMLLGDLANQALGRNQGFRYAGKQAILLIDGRWYPTIIQEGVLRYRLNPWSTDLPWLNKKTTKKSVREAIQMSVGQSALERRLIELVHTHHEFGLSEDALRLAAKLPRRQQAMFQAWREKAVAEAPGLTMKQLKRKAQMAENLRRHRERQKAAASQTVMTGLPSRVASEIRRDQRQELPQDAQ